MAKVVTSGQQGGSSRPWWPPRRPPQGRSQRLVSWGLQLFPHDACGMQASRSLWALRRPPRCVPGLRSGTDKVQSSPAAQTIWLIALRRPKSTSLSSGNHLAAAEHSPKSGDRPQVASSYCQRPGIILQALLLLVNTRHFIVELLASGFC